MYLLHTDFNEVEIIEELIPEFYNLTSNEFGYLEHTNDWLEVLKVIKHCPKLQNLAINQVCSSLIPSRMIHFLC